MTRRLILGWWLIVSGCSHTAPSPSEHDRIADARITLSIAYLHRHEPQKALFNLIQAGKIAPHYIRLQLAQAYYYETVGETDKAKQQYVLALNEHPNHPDVYNNYGTFLCKQGDVKQAQNYFAQVYSRANYPQIAASYENAALCSLKSGNTLQANQYFLQALKHDPKRFQSQFYLVQMAIKAQQFAVARTRLATFIQDFGTTKQSLALQYQLDQEITRHR
ncbi:type IV pilus biogenesis/stability protein PilW [Vibrio spartinae]|uniref:Type IV pilus biogenesis/stability protein PilW n=1 Tax=Vibrio spartinae TaxID=1918945 RepID=A0ABX6QZM7_9VIBR|nr:type IV pilus biogenesis/stability protein PilW [Vibrio spartinae]QMV14706.1 type IV pilus biogenesis/stability protein PilW [Vibrio spartinae]